MPSHGRPPTRREFLYQLAGAAAAASTRPLGATQPGRKRVVVIGGGLAGLCAAYELTSAGHAVTLLEGQERPGGRVHTLRQPFSDGLYAEAGASRIPVSHDLTVGYARRFELPLVSFEPAGLPSVRYAYRQRVRSVPGAPFEWPAAVPVRHRQLTPTEVRQRYITPLVDQITNPLAADWIPPALARYDTITRDQYLRARGVSESVLHLMNLGSTPIARFRSFLDVLRELAVGPELRRRNGVSEDRMLKIDGGNDRLPHAFADRLREQIRYGCRVWRIKNGAAGAAVFFTHAGSSESIQCDYVVCAVPFSVARRLEFSPALSAAKSAVVNGLRYVSVVRVYAQCRERYWTADGSSGFGDTDHPMELWDATYGQPGSRGILMAFFQGPKARSLGGSSNSKQLQYGLSAMNDVYPGVHTMYERGVVKNWDADPWARGAVAYLLPGQVTAFDAHMATPEGRIHFAGEHASSLRGWMQGALESGRRVAQEIDGR